MVKTHYVWLPCGDYGTERVKALTAMSRCAIMAFIYIQELQNSWYMHIHLLLLEPFNTAVQYEHFQL